MPFLIHRILHTSCIFEEKKTFFWKICLFFHLRYSISVPILRVIHHPVKQVESLLITQVCLKRPDHSLRFLLLYVLHEFFDAISPTSTIPHMFGLLCQLIAIEAIYISYNPSYQITF